MSRKTPLGRVLGLGSAKEGTDHFWGQRVSAVAVAVLGVWFVVSVLGLSAGGMGYAQVVGWLSAPWAAAAMITLLIAVAYHSMLGIQVIIEDYVHTGWLKVTALVGQRFAHFILALAGSLAVLRIAVSS